MKILVTKMRASLAMGLALIATTAHAQVETVLWDVPDPYVGEPDGEFGNWGSQVVDASTLAGLPGIATGHDMIGEFTFDGAQQFQNVSRTFTFGTGEGEFDPALVGTTFQLSVDYYIPSGGSLQAEDLFYFQISTNGVNTLDGNSAGFFTNTAETTDAWNTLTLEYTVLDNAPTNNIEALLIGVDGGFSGIPDADGTTPTVYFDNLMLVGGLEDGILGDFDGDGDVDLADLDEYNGRLGLTIADNAELADLDLDDNGTIELADFQQHYGTLVETSNGGKGTFPGDLNLDGIVDVFGDGFVFLGNVGNAATSWAEGDFNADQQVDIFGDGFLLLNNIGNDNGGAAAAPATSAVPEPGTLSLLALAGIGVVARRRR